MIKIWWEIFSIIISFKIFIVYTSQKWPVITIILQGKHDPHLISKTWEAREYPIPVLDWVIMRVFTLCQLLLAGKGGRGVCVHIQSMTKKPRYMLASHKKQELVPWFFSVSLLWASHSSSFQQALSPESRRCKAEQRQTLTLYSWHSESLRGTVSIRKSKLWGSNKVASGGRAALERFTVPRQKCQERLCAEKLS